MRTTTTHKYDNNKSKHSIELIIPKNEQTEAKKRNSVKSFFLPHIFHSHSLLSSLARSPFSCQCIKLRYNKLELNFSCHKFHGNHVSMYIPFTCANWPVGSVINSGADRKKNIMRKQSPQFTRSPRIYC